MSRYTLITIVTCGNTARSGQGELPPIITELYAGRACGMKRIGCDCARNRIVPKIARKH